MRTIPGVSGRFLSRLWVEEDEFDAIARHILQTQGLYPDTPAPIDIELLIDKLFPCSYRFVKLPPKLMGRIIFDHEGPRVIEFQEQLDRPYNALINRRCRSTFGHECGHGILHSYLFSELWNAQSDETGKRLKSVLNDKSRYLDEARRNADQENWFEYQANRLMASLLLPIHPIIAQIGEHYLEPDHHRRLSFGDRRQLSLQVAKAFDVTPTLALHRLDDIFNKVLPRLNHLHITGEPNTYGTLADFCHPAEMFAQLRAA